jgi:hypothetical protein
MDSLQKMKPEQMGLLTLVVLLVAYMRQEPQSDDEGVLGNRGRLNDFKTHDLDDELKEKVIGEEDNEVEEMGSEVLSHRLKFLFVLVGLTIVVYLGWKQ